MERWGAAVVAIACAAGLSACDHARHAPKPLAVSTPVAPGTAFVAPVVASGAVRVETGDAPQVRSPQMRFADDGLHVELDRCELRAPGLFVVTGTVTLPRGAHDVPGALSFGIRHGDVGNGFWGRRVTFLRSGAFAVVAQATFRSRTTDDRFPRTPTDDEGPCFADATSTAVAVDRSALNATVTVTGGRFDYRAPAGSIQALAVAAPLAQPEDPRTISAYTVWAGARVPITTVWVPALPGEPPALLKVQPASPHCAQITVGAGIRSTVSARIEVVTRRDCGEPRDQQGYTDTRTPVPGAAGFTWLRTSVPGSPIVAARSDGDVDVWVEGATRADVARAAGTLATRRNLAVTPAPAARPATLDAALRQYLAATPGWSERARFHYRGHWMVVAAEGEHGGSETPWNYALLEMGTIADGWWLERATSGGGAGGCFSGPQLSAAQSGDEYAWSVARDPEWSIQGFVDGRWQTVASTRGVTFVDSTDPNHPQYAGRQRPLDASGHVPACFAAENPTDAG